MALSATCLWASVEELKPYLGFLAHDVAHDAMLELRAEAVTQEIERETGRIYVTRTITAELHSGTGSRRVELRYYPVTAITALTEDGEAVASADYSLDSASGVITLLNGDTWSTLDVKNISVTYTAGYARTAAELADVKLLGIDLLRARYLTWGNNADVFSYQAQAGGGTVQPVSDWISIRKKLDSLATAVRVGGLRVAGA